VQRDGDAVHHTASHPAFSRREIWTLAARWTLGIVAFVAGMALLASFVREPLEAVGRSFVARFGYAGMAFGTFLADGFQFPVPPQFYMLVSVSSHASPAISLGAIALGSLAGGLVGFVGAGRLARLPIISRRLARSERLVARAVERFGYWSVLLASLSPVPYSVLCLLSGAHRLGWSFFGLVSLCRLPRILFFYWVVRASFQSG
jgi:membrane protein YqaA with SNARE-associated domain